MECLFNVLMQLQGAKLGGPEVVGGCSLIEKVGGLQPDPVASFTCVSGCFCMEWMAASLISLTFLYLVSCCRLPCTKVYSHIPFLDIVCIIFPLSLFAWYVA